MNEYILEAQKINKVYRNGSGYIKAVDNISISVKKGEFVAIIGPSGSGKTTFLNILSGLQLPNAGNVIIDGTNITDIEDDDERTLFRRKYIGLIFQRFNLFEMLTVYDNIVFPCKLNNQKVDQNFLNCIIESLHIKEKLNCMPYELSGGQQQRVAIARALITKPKIIFADEPTASLDSQTSVETIELLNNTAKNLMQTVVMVTHDEQLAKMAERQFFYKDGNLIERG